MPGTRTTKAIVRRGDRTRRGSRENSDSSRAALAHPIAADREPTIEVLQLTLSEDATNRSCWRSPNLGGTVVFVHELDPRDDEITGLDRLSEARSHEPSRSRALALPSASRAGTLTNLELRDVPTDPGYCAAWLKDEAALAEAGIDAPHHGSFTLARPSADLGSGSGDI
jgi:hypothetical protein